MEGFFFFLKCCPKPLYNESPTFNIIFDQLQKEAITQMYDIANS